MLTGRAFRKAFERWSRATLGSIMRFSPGYRSGGIFGVDEIQEGGVYTAEEWVFAHESWGYRGCCADPEGAEELLERKDCMNLTVAMWKEELRSLSSRGTRDLCVSFIAELSEEHPEEWLRRIGVCVPDETVTEFRNRTGVGRRCLLTGPAGASVYALSPSAHVASSAPGLR